jgi:hypothetical protein
MTESRCASPTGRWLFDLDGNQSNGSGVEEAGINPDSPNCIEERPLAVQAQSAAKATGPSILPGSDGEHLLQEKYGSVARKCLL